MKNLVQSKKLSTIAVMLVAITLIALSLTQVVSGTHAATTPGEPNDIKGISGMFFPNPSDSGAFDVAAGTTPLFTRKFPVIYFNPMASMQSCTNPTGIDENSHPMTDVAPQSDGSCKLNVIQGKQGKTVYQAGVGSLTSFQAVFTAFITVTKARQESFSITADDGWIFSLGPNSSSAQPTYVSGPTVGAPASGLSPFNNYAVMGAMNTYESPTTSVVTVNFPAPGNYPIELDYTEAAGGQLMLTLVPEL